MFAVSTDTPESHSALMESRGLEFEILSDPDALFYERAGIIEKGAMNVQRGVVIYAPDETLLFREITADPVSVLLESL